MSFTSFYRRYRQLLSERFPRTQILGEEWALDHLVSPHRLRLPHAVLEQAQAAVRSHYQLLQRDSFRRQLPPVEKLSDIPLRTDSVLMAYDFHTTPAGGAHLVEVNTNASTFLLSALAYETHGLRAGIGEQDAWLQLRKAFEREAQASGLVQVDRIAIVDEEVREQKMYVEFLMFADWFQQAGWLPTVANADTLQVKGHRLVDVDDHEIQFVYNRLTDFLLTDERWAALSAAYERSLAAVSPHPWAYHLFSDKGRLVELSQPGWLEEAGASDEEMAALRAVLIPTFELRHFGSPDEIWSRRKGLFFKPRRSYGGKSVYRGSSVSKKVFERLMAEDCLVQEYVPPQSWQVSASDSYMENWKFDVRFFAYRDQIQMAIARCYQGQVTNFSSPFGGLTVVEFV